MKKLLSVLIALTMAFSFIACKNDEDNDNSSSSASASAEVFKEQSDGLLLVTNTSQQDLALFHDSVSAANFMGAIRGGVAKHRMKLERGGQLYIIHAVKYSDYEKAKTSSVSGLKVVDSTLVYSDAVQDTSCSLGLAKYSGDCEIRFQNQTPYYVEVGKGSANDEDMFYTMKPNSTESVFVDYDKNGYVIYMICNLPIKRNNKIIGVQRKFVENWADILMPTPDKVTGKTISKTAVQTYSYYTDGYVRIVNNFSSGFIVRNGETQLDSTLGHGALGSGNDEVYQLAGTSEGKNYSQIRLFGAGESNNKVIPAFSVKNGYKYLIEIKSDGTITTKEIGAISEDEEEDLTW